MFTVKKTVTQQVHINKGLIRVLLEETLRRRFREKSIVLNEIQ